MFYELFILLLSDVDIANCLALDRRAQKQTSHTFWFFIILFSAPILLKHKLYCTLTTGNQLNEPDRSQVRLCCLPTTAFLRMRICCCLIVARLLFQYPPECVRLFTRQEAHLELPRFSIRADHLKLDQYLPSHPSADRQQTAARMAPGIWRIRGLLRNDLLASSSNGQAA